MSATPSLSRRGSAARTPGGSPRKAPMAQRTPMSTSTTKLMMATTPASAGAPAPLHASVSDIPLTPLDFSVMYAKIDNFMVTFNAFISGELAGTEMLREEHEVGMSLDREEIRSLRSDVEDAQKEQSELWEAIKSQKDADAAERADIGKLKSTQFSLGSRRSNLESELRELERLSESKRRQQDGKRQQLSMQRGRNGGELDRLSAISGINVRPTKVPNQLKISFNLLNPDDFAAESCFVLDLPTSDRSYHIVHCDPPLERARLEEIAGELSRTRDPYETMKRMRAEFKSMAEEARTRRRRMV
ncbi:hypothetical protein K437DRAFT_255118 [Tilletiaria anomala UBC 951]|uniref:Kinetochore protein SPC25 n=1 Tax=Tilletiaria anomala (strain ATCC 24038 / CBS 436.72 / UBC 951) TaxID=1037660 RepID=A0A066W8Y3_TILAU|nr:uncharacterized protein K437DRAFT_255118 [Tilletiaria anomala UBC 951]KDN50407.1 hypothetical protein K437DRAFT_255118 [Tilletiaria anomala UBC 951]